MAVGGMPGPRGFHDLHKAGAAELRGWAIPQQDPQAQSTGLEAGPKLLAYPMSSRL